MTTTNTFAKEWIEKAIDIKEASRNTDAINETNDKQALELSKASWLLGFFQIFMIILYAIFAHGSEIIVSTNSNIGPDAYNMFIGVEIMMFVGFGYLMTFLKLYGLGAVGLTALVVAMGLQWSVFTESFFTQIAEYDYKQTAAENWSYVGITMYSLLNALYAISAVLISFGGCIGKLNPSGLIFMTFFELIFHSFNFKILMTKAMNLNDMGGTYIDHMFGAYFGLGVSWMLGPPDVEPSMGYIPDIFSLIGTIFLWIYWPSFIAGAAEPNSDQQQRALVHTIISLSSSTVCTFWLSSILNKHKKFRPVDIQNATLAGGVAIGCVANLDIGGVGSCMVGCAAGCVSTLGYNILQPYLEKNFKLHDTCGIHNLHGMPSIIGGISSVLAAAHHMDKDIYGDTYKDQPWLQLLAIPFCVGFAIISGLITGYIISKFSPQYPETEIKAFQDSTWWAVADDYDRTIYSELALLVGEKDSLNKSISKSLNEFSSHHGRRPTSQFPIPSSSSHQKLSDLNKV